MSNAPLSPWEVIAKEAWKETTFGNMNPSRTVNLAAKRAYAAGLADRSPLPPAPTDAAARAAGYAAGLARARDLAACAAAETEAHARSQSTDLATAQSRLDATRTRAVVQRALVADLDREIAAKGTTP